MLVQCFVLLVGSKRFPTALPSAQDHLISTVGPCFMLLVGSKRFPTALPSAQDHLISTVGPCYMPYKHVYSLTSVEYSP